MSPTQDGRGAAGAAGVKYKSAATTNPATGSNVTTRIVFILIPFPCEASLPIKRAYLLTPSHRHWYAFNRTLSARPIRGVLRALPVK
jgi:hypothetical protein